MGATVCRSLLPMAPNCPWVPATQGDPLPAGPCCPCTPAVARPALQSRDEVWVTGHHAEVAAGGCSWGQGDKRMPKQGERWGMSSTTLPGAGAPVGTRRRPDPQQGHLAWKGTNLPVRRRQMSPSVPAPAPSWHLLFSQLASLSLCSPAMLPQRWRRFGDAKAIPEGGSSSNPARSSRLAQHGKWGNENVALPPLPPRKVEHILQQRTHKAIF